MKTKIIGWFYLIFSTIGVVFSVYVLYVAYSSLPASQGGMIAIASNQLEIINRLIYIGLLGLPVSIFGLFWSSALRRHKKWSWYTGLIFIPLVLISNGMYVLWSFSLISVVAVAFNIFVIYSLIVEKKEFFPSNDQLN